LIVPAGSCILSSTRLTAKWSFCEKHYIRDTAGRVLDGKPRRRSHHHLLPVLEAFGGGDRVLFALAGSDPTRTNPAYILTGGGYTALGFNIQSWDPDAPGTLDIAIQFSDGDSAVVNLSRPGGVAETDPQFFGIISSAAITSLMINEPPEVSIPCCEEVSLDDFVASTAVPEPGSALLGGAALVLLLARRIRR
jgi:hypothetical protein